MLGLKLNHVSKRGYWWRRNEQELQQPWYWPSSVPIHYNDVKVNAMASQITSLTSVYSIVYSGAENIKAPRHWPLCGESPGTGEFPAQIASNAENVSIWWLNHDFGLSTTSVIADKTNNTELCYKWAEQYIYFEECHRNIIFRFSWSVLAFVSSPSCNNAISVMRKFCW